MPLKSYLIIHRDARLSPDARRWLQTWFASPAATPGPRADSTGSGAGGQGGSWEDEEMPGK